HGGSHALGVAGDPARPVPPRCRTRADAVGPAEARQMSVFLTGDASPPTNVIQWFTKQSFRTRSGAIPHQVWLTVWHRRAAVAISVLIAVPLAIVLAHYRRGGVVVGWLVNTGRAIPTVAI